MQNILLERQTPIKISVVIPVYNEEKYLAQCLSSVAKQTLKDIEIICVDDGSVDSSAQIISRFAEKDDRIRYIHQSNSGAGRARNVGVAAATGEYIAFMDSDDCYPFEDVLEIMYNKAVANNANICGGSLIVIKHGVKKLIDKFYGAQSGNTFTEEGVVRFIDYQYDYAFYRFIYKRQFLLDNRIKFPLYRRYQDPPFMLRAMMAAGEFYALPLFTYVHHLGYKNLYWPAEKVSDMLDAMKYNLTVTANNGLPKAFAYNCYRLNNDFCDMIVETAIYNDPRNLIFPKLHELDKLISAQNLYDGEQRIECAPYAKLCERLIKQNYELRREGWFTNKKLFRLYTWPIRFLGRLLRKIKHGRKNK